MKFRCLTEVCCICLALLAGAGCSFRGSRSQFRRPHTPAVVQSGGAWDEVDAGPVFTPNPPGTPTPDSARRDRDPSTILVLPTSRVNTGTDSGPLTSHNEISIAVNPGPYAPNAPDSQTDTFNDNYVLGANDYSAARPNGSCGAYYSADSAQTWLETAGGVLPTQAGYDSARDPAVAFDKANNIYFACLNLNSSNNNTGIYVFRSTDMGASYLTPTLVVSGTGTGPNDYHDFNDKEYIATDPYSPNGNVYLSWTRFNNSTGSGPATRADIMFAGSIDHGASFASPLPHVVNTTAHLSNQGSVPAAGTAANEVYVAWQDFSVPSIIVSKSLDGGITFTPEVVVANNIGGWPQYYLDGPTNPPRDGLVGENGPFRVNSFPTIDVCRNPSSKYFGQVYVAWAEYSNNPVFGGPNHGRVVISKSIDGGTTWSSPPTQVSDEPPGIIVGTGGSGPEFSDSFMPWMSVDPQCKINVAFYGRRDDQANRKFDVYMADSTTGANTFSSDIFSGNTRITTASSSNYQFNGTFIGDYIGLASTDNAHGTYHHHVQRGVPAWMDTTKGQQDAAVATALEVGTWANLDLVLSPSTLNPGADNIEFVFPGDYTGLIKSVWGVVPNGIFNAAGAAYDSTFDQTTFKFFNPTSLVPPGGSAHVGFTVNGNPTTIRSFWTLGSNVVAKQAESAVDFRYNSATKGFSAAFYTLPCAAPFQITRLRFAVVDLPVQLGELNPSALPGALAVQGTQLADLRVLPPIFGAGGDAQAAQAAPACTPPTFATFGIPGQIKAFQAVVLVADLTDGQGNTTQFFTQKIAKDADARVCDANGDHQIDINDIRLMSQRLGSPAIPGGDRADADGDGFITANDVRICSQSMLVVTPASVAFTNTIGRSPASESRVIQVTTDGLQVAFTTSANQGSNAACGNAWLSVSPGGTTTGTTVGVPVTISYTVAGLPVTTSTICNGTVTIASANVSGSPVVVPVTLTITSNSPPNVRILPLESSTVYKQIRLTAVASDPGGSPLSYKWRYVTKAAAISHDDTAIADAQFDEGFGPYTFEVRVTNAVGQSATATITIAYVGR